MHNIVSFCMDSLRHDMFIKADAPNLHNFTSYKKVYSRAGCTVPSLFALFMNECWYQSDNMKLVQDHKPWCWIPTDLREKGYYTAFLSDNWFVKLYAPTFRKGFDNFKIFEFGFGVKEIVEETIKIFNTIKKPKFIFILTMETHQPYSIRGEKPKKKTTVKNQLRSIEYIDGFFGRLVKRLHGTNTEVTVFSDHGDLDPELEGVFGHGHSIFHRKLFEIPLGRKTI